MLECFSSAESGFHYRWRYELQGQQWRPLRALNWPNCKEKIKYFYSVWPLYKLQVTWQQHTQVRQTTSKKTMLGVVNIYTEIYCFLHQAAVEQKDDNDLTSLTVVSHHLSEYQYIIMIEGDYETRAALSSLSINCSTWEHVYSKKQIKPTLWIWAWPRKYRISSSTLTVPKTHEGVQCSSLEFHFWDCSIFWQRHGMFENSDTVIFTHHACTWCVFNISQQPLRCTC